MKKNNELPIDKTIWWYFEEQDYFGENTGWHFDEIQANTNTQINQTFNDPTRISWYDDSPRDFWWEGNNNFFI